MSNKRKKYNPEFKAKVALAAVKNEATISDMAARFFIQKAQSLNRKQRKQMIDPLVPELSIMGQCQLLNISRSSIYYKRKPISAEDLELMRLIDEQYLKTPSWGSRSMKNHLRRLGYRINRKKVQRLMRPMGLEAIYPKPKTSRPHPRCKEL